MYAILMQAIFLPILLAPVAYIVGRRVGEKGGWLTFLIMLYSTFLIILSPASEPETYDWQPIGTFGLRVDGLSLPFAATIAVLSTVLAVYSMPYMRHRVMEEEHEGRRKVNVGSRLGLYNMLFLLYAAGMMGTVLATNLIQFYIFFELMLIPSFFLIAEFGYGAKERISLMYFIWTHLGALIFLAGLLSIGFLYGSFDLSVIGRIGEDLVPYQTRVWIAVALIVGLAVKLAAFGLHIWLPHAHAEAPTPISALLSPAMIGIGGYALIRILLFLFPLTFSSIAYWLSIWGLVTMLYGGFMAMVQDDIKRLFAYSSVSQMGYIIFGIASAHYIGVSGSVFQYVSHGTGKGILFMAAGAIILQTGGLRSISKMGGLAKRLPITATSAMIGFLVIMGAPPLNGFQSEWMLFFGAFTSALKAGSIERVVMTMMALASTPMTVGYALWTMKRVFFGQLSEELKGVKEAPLSMTVPLLTLAIISVVLGVDPSLINDRLIPTVRSAIGG